nr:hypothetical protein [Mycoplasmopsis bovis]
MDFSTLKNSFSLNDALASSKKIIVPERATELIRSVKEGSGYNVETGTGSFIYT